MEMSDMGMTAPETSTREAAGAQAAVEPTAMNEPTEPEFFDSLFRKRKKNRGMEDRGNA